MLLDGVRDQDDSVILSVSVSDHSFETIDHIVN